MRIRVVAGLIGAACLALLSWYLFSARARQTEESECRREYSFLHDQLAFMDVAGRVGGRPDGSPLLADQAEAHALLQSLDADARTGLERQIVLADVRELAAFDDCKTTTVKTCMDAVSREEALGSEAFRVITGQLGPCEQFKIDFDRPHEGAR